MKNLTKSWIIVGSLGLSLGCIQSFAGTEGKFRFQTDLKGNAVQNFLSEAESYLPKRLKEKLNQPISVIFVDLDQRLSSESQKKIYGKTTSSGEIQLNSSFISEIVNGPQRAKTYPNGHGNLYRLALATLLHEVSHLYDFSMEQSTHGIVSGDKNYRKIAGWIGSKNPFKIFSSARMYTNKITSRSPDLYELKSPAEHFAVNMEYFLLDPEYRCRRPLEYEYLIRHFEFIPKKLSACSVNTEVFFHVNDSNFRSENSVNLDPDRIYQIHYLLVHKGESFFSHWGHSMFRFVTCAPERKTMGPDCLKDVKYHAVLSYSANVNDARLSSWKGLTGKYKSQAFLFPFTDIIDEYNKTELRDVSSLPLKLTLDEKRRFVYKILEQYWEYQGKYYFLTNNCGTESVRVIKSAVLQDQIKKIKPASPKGLQKDLIRQGLLDPSFLQNRAQAIEKGYYFPSSLQRSEKALSIIRARLKDQGFSFQEGLDYLKKSQIFERRKWFEMLDKTEDQKIFASFFYLESVIHHLKKRELEGQAFEALEKNKNDLYETVLTTANNVNRGSDVYEGYGIPLKYEYDSTEMGEAGKVSGDHLENLKTWIRQNFPEQIRNIDLIEENMDLFRKTMLRK